MGFDHQVEDGDEYSNEDLFQHLYTVELTDAK